MVDEEGGRELGIWTSIELDDLKEKKHREKEREVFQVRDFLFLYLLLDVSFSAKNS